MIVTSKIYPCLWYDNQAEEAANFYISVFKTGRITAISHNGENMPGKAGSVLTVAFELDGHQFLALNGGPRFKFNEAISLTIMCETQAEIDHFWEKLTEGGQTQACGWLKDKYGLSWQVTPRILIDMIHDKNRKKVQAAFDAMMPMVKLDIARLKQAYDAA
jgi:predicted 3-demethylubiquinone-9 3-methyltransferase (glyoxalase superfamily)